MHRGVLHHIHTISDLGLKLEVEKSCADELDEDNCSVFKLGQFSHDFRGEVDRNYCFLFRRCVLLYEVLQQEQ